MDANKLMFLNSEPYSEPLTDRDGTAITKDGRPVLHIPKPKLDADLDNYFGYHNYGTEQVDHSQQGDVIKVSVKCWYIPPGTDKVRYTSGSAGDHLTRIYNRFTDKGEAMAIMIPTLQTLAEKNAWAKLGKRFGRDLNKDLDKPVSVSAPAEESTQKTLTPHEQMVKAMLDHIATKSDKAEALQKINKQGIINTPYLLNYFNSLQK